MTDHTYNPDKRYEMMAAILPNPSFDNLPDAAEILEDLHMILRLCYLYTTEADTPREQLASALAHRIVDELFESWNQYGVDFESHWNQPNPEAKAKVSDKPAPAESLFE